MASIPQASVSRPLRIPVTGRNGLLDRYFYFAMSLLVAVIVVWGFSHTVNANLFHASPPRPLLLWIHAAVFSGWVVFFIVQSALVRKHQVRWHRSMGWFGAVLGTTMIVLGTATAIVMGRFDTGQLHMPDSDAFLIVPLFDMVAFAASFGLAVYWRRKPELHRRLIFIATCGLLAAAFGRVDYLILHDLTYVCVDGVIFLGVVRDLFVNRRIHAVYWIAFPALATVQAFVIHTVHSGSWWISIAHWILR